MKAEKFLNVFFVLSFAAVALYSYVAEGHRRVLEDMTTYIQPQVVCRETGRISVLTTWSLNPENDRVPVAFCHLKIWRSPFRKTSYVPFQDRFG